MHRRRTRKASSPAPPTRRFDARLSRRTFLRRSPAAFSTQRTSRTRRHA
jgi:hypothetical protein